MRNVLIGSVVAGALVIGGGVAYATGHDAPRMAVRVGAERPAPTTTPGADHGKPGEKRHRGGSGLLDDVLDRLVAEGTITQEQADAIRAEFDKEWTDRKRSFGHRGDRSGARLSGMFGMFRGLEEKLAASLGLTTEELHVALRDGSTISELAEAHGTTLDAVTRVMVDELKAEIQARVAAGDLTADQATKLEGRIDEMVESFLEGGRFGFGRFGHDGAHADRGAEPDEGSPEAPSTSTTPPANKVPPSTTAPEKSTAPSTTAPAPSPSTTTTVAD